MKKILQYIAFDSSVDFVKWQETNNVEVYLVQPVIHKSIIDVNKDAEKSHATHNHSLGVFVTYTVICEEE